MTFLTKLESCTEAWRPKAALAGLQCATSMTLELHRGGMEQISLNPRTTQTKMASHSVTTTDSKRDHPSGGSLTDGQRHPGRTSDDQRRVNSGRRRTEHQLAPAWRMEESAGWRDKCRPEGGWTTSCHGAGHDPNLSSDKESRRKGGSHTDKPTSERDWLHDAISGWKK